MMYDEQVKLSRFNIIKLATINSTSGMFKSIKAWITHYKKQSMPSYLKNGSASNGGLLDTSQYYNQLIYAPRQATISSITTDTTGFR